MITGTGMILSISARVFFTEYIQFIFIMMANEHRVFSGYLVVKPNNLFTVISKKMFEFNLPIRLRTAMIDFEQGVYNVFTKHYPTVTV